LIVERGTLVHNVKFKARKLSSSENRSVPSSDLAERVRRDHLLFTPRNTVTVLVPWRFLDAGQLRHAASLVIAGVQKPAQQATFAKCELGHIRRPLDGAMIIVIASAR